MRFVGSGGGGLFASFAKRAARVWRRAPFTGTCFEVQPPLPTAPTGVCCTWIDADEADKRGVYWNAVGGGVCGAVDGYDVALCAASSAYECTPRNCLP